MRGWLQPTSVRANPAKPLAGLILHATEQRCQPACKPGSVWPPPESGNVAAIPLGPMSPSASRNLPGRWAGNCPRRLPLVPSLFGLAPGGVCHAASVAGRAVGSYPTLSPLPRHCPCPKARTGRGGLLSVALSLGSPPPAISRHRVSMEPGLSSRTAFRLSSVRPPGQLAGRIKRFDREKAMKKPGLHPGLSSMRQIQSRARWYLTFLQYAREVLFMRLAACPAL